MKIGELARRTRTNAPTIRYYEKSVCCRLRSAAIAVNEVMATVIAGD